MKEKTVNLPTLVLKRSVRKRYAFVIAIAITVMVAAALLVPQGAARIPLDVSYTVGERMVYYTTEAITVQNVNATTGQVESNGYLNANPSLNYTDTIEVVDFNGETYTLNHTQAIKTAGPLTSISFVEKMNKTGYSTWIFPQAPNVLASNRSGASNPALTGLLARSEVTVGDTWVIPVTSNSSYANTTGNMTLRFVGIQDITVPAGTYKVFRVDTESDDTVITLRLSRSNATTITSTFNMTISGQTFIEYDTGRQIEQNMHIKGTVQTTPTSSPASGLNYTAQDIPILLEDITVQTQLIESIMPSENSTPSPLALWNPSSVEQASMSFLKNVVNLDVGHYSVQFGALDAAGFAKCTLTSADSSLDVLFNLNNSRVFWCRLYPLRGSPVFAELSTNNLEAAKNLLDRYQTNAQTAYVPALRSMLDNFTWLTEGMQGTFTTSDELLNEGEIKLKLTVNEDEYSFVWSKTGSTNPSDMFVLTIRNGRFEFFTDVYVMKGV
jgi:hypothetical protein